MLEHRRELEDVKLERESPERAARALIEKIAVRISTDATLVLVTTAPSNPPPAVRCKVLIQIFSIAGGASGAATVGVGQVAGIAGATTTRSLSCVDTSEAQPVRSANATAICANALHRAPLSIG